MLLNGEDGPKDFDKAMLLITQPMREGEVSACWYLRDKHEHGIDGTKPDETKARQWNQLAESIMARDVSEMPLFGQPLPDLKT